MGEKWIEKIMKKVLIVVAGNNGTIGRCSWNLYHAFMNREDVEVKCVGIHRFKGGLDDFSQCDFFSDVCEDNPNNILRQINWLKRIKESFMPDMTISTLYSTNFINALSGKKDYKVGIFHAPHKQGKASGWLKYAFSVLQYWLIYPKLDYCACVSKEAEEDLRSIRTIDRKRIGTIYNVHQVDEILKKADIPLQEEVLPTPYIIYCGRLDANKAPLRAIKALSKNQSQLSLVFVGKGDESFVSELKKQVDDLGMSSRVFFLGEKSNPYPYIKAAKALVSCSYSESLPGVIIEALALGVPVVSTNSSRGIWEILLADESYNISLADSYQTKWGVITSNLAFKDNSKEGQDIINLAQGMEQVLTYSKIPESEFLSKVDSNTITTQFLSLLKQSK